jgi:holo-[acyl-carrier protein] synthase
MIVGVGVDVCPADRWRRLLDRFGERSLRRVLPQAEVDALLGGHPERLAESAAGRWALREALGKAMGTGLDGWSPRELLYERGRASVAGRLEKMLADLGAGRVHATLSHDGGLSVAVVVLERNPLT